MTKWDWLEKTPHTWPFALRVTLKAAGLFILLNIVFALLTPLENIGRISIYNTLVPGRTRLPYGENPAESYSLSLNNIPATFASHKISGRSTTDEFRLLVLGDSGTWGWLLPPDQTLAAQINALELQTSDGRPIIAYNLGYPIMSLTKDLLLLDYALRYEPDAILWLVTLESMPLDKQLFPPIVQNNTARTRDLIEAYTLNLDPDDTRFIDPDFLESTLIGQRRELADWLRLQLYGVMWATTGIDQIIPDDYPLRSSDFAEDISWQEYTEPQPLTESELAFDVLSAGLQLAGDKPVLIVNEPIFISEGENSDLRYNFWYPRWAYDEYRTQMQSHADSAGWNYLDLWDSIAADEFTDSPVHITAEGTHQLALALQEPITALSAP